ncbi:hypothetical protein SAMN06297164_2567 [Nitrosomonas ureae]|uniref:Uncharacterized protein n=1 Tax=Nitrosomonas ureae TaxID=44577 RepID=A0A286ACD0_9PROT|nr:hypothetical protein SAMN06297164_2567 [Nitrosomonas ureae]
MMNNHNKLFWFVLIFGVFIFPSTDVLSESDTDRKELTNLKMFGNLNLAELIN